MTLHSVPLNRLRSIRAGFVVFAFVTAVAFSPAFSQSNLPKGADCRIESVDYKGWHAQQMSNRWVQLIIVPQNGGRLIQVTFAGHPYLFVNPKFAGKYLPPDSSQWFNYGGDKLWLLPEGNNDEQHWAGGSDILDDGPFSFRKLSEGQRCEIELTGPSDPQTGIQFTRNIRLDADSPRIGFHAFMKNITGHTLEWSMQSVSQYDTSVSGAQGAEHAAGMNNDFWTFTPANRSSSYLNRYHVRFGPAENPAVSVRDDDLFTVHYVHMAAELWLDSTEGWLAVVDGKTQYAMVERFRYEESKRYPGKASVIFWTNGPEMRLHGDGIPSLSADPDASPYYLEAEINSPMCRLRPGESCDFETEWFPTRAGSEFHGVTDAGIVIRPLRATALESGKIKLSASFGVFFSGRLVAHFYDEHGRIVGVMPILDVSPAEAVSLETEIGPPGKPARVSLHLEDEHGVDRGSLQEVRMVTGDNH
ncbi:MAG TPA: hypothetical protein VFO46_23400 [Candidatus Sulfotelmatobacter sp.]|nr:hypothetical protein [Candidatus Sulfotelmatobacter sp.]